MNFDGSRPVETRAQCSRKQPSEDGMGPAVAGSTANSQSYTGTCELLQFALKQRTPAADIPPPDVSSRQF
jgi:hypothetical protein